MANIVIIGSNRGIGLEMVKQLTARGDTVHATCRTSSPALDAVEGATVHSGVDVTAADTLRALAERLGPDSLDVAVVVAGVLRGTSLANLDADMIRNQFEVNALGPLMATSALLGCVRDGGKVALLTSRMGSIADNTSGGSYAYRMSKAALNMAARSLSHDLRPREIAVSLLHPGWVRTDMTGNTGHLDADEAAAGLIARIDEVTLETSGVFFHQNGERLPW